MLLIRIVVHWRCAISALTYADVNVLHLSTMHACCPMPACSSCLRLPRVAPAAAYCLPPPAPAADEEVDLAELAEGADVVHVPAAGTGAFGTRFHTLSLGTGFF